MFILSNVGKLYDGASSGSASVRTGVDVVVDGGRIKELAPHRAPAEGGPPRIDYSAFTVTPGLVDCHGHVTVVGLSAEDMAKTEGQHVMLYVERVLFTTLVDGGVTTVRDVGGATDAMKRAVDEGLVIGPRLKIAICMLSTTGGHADFRGPDRCHDTVSALWAAGPGRPSSIVDGPWDCRKRVREIAACGADLIKICTSPGVASPTDHLEHQDFSAEEIAAICTEAEARGLKVAAHAHSRSGIELAIDNGVHDIQHISFMDERLAHKAARAGCTVTPTSWVIEGELPVARGLSEFVMGKVRKAAASHGEAVRLAHAAGLPILGGTDPVLPRMHGRNYMELVALMKGGLSALEAWHGMTGRAAQAIGLGDGGTLAPGQRADLLVSRADVIEDPARFDAGALVEVIKDGVGYRGGLPQVPQRSFADISRELWGTGA